jgi:hypothetical protein
VPASRCREWNVHAADTWVDSVNAPLRSAVISRRYRPSSGGTVNSFENGWFPSPIRVPSRNRRTFVRSVTHTTYFASLSANSGRVSTMRSPVRVTQWSASIGTGKPGPNTARFHDSFVVRPVR